MISLGIAAAPVRLPFSVTLSRASGKAARSEL